MLTLGLDSSTWGVLKEVDLNTVRPGAALRCQPGAEMWVPSQARFRQDKIDNPLAAVYCTSDDLLMHKLCLHSMPHTTWADFCGLSCG